MLSLPEFSEVYFSDALGDVSVENNNLISIEIFDKIVGLCFSVGKDNSSILRVIPLNELKDGFMSFLLFDHECKVFNSL